MRFALLLYGLYKKLGFTAKKYPAFRDKLKEKDYTLVFATKKGGWGRYFSFNSGDIKSGRGSAPQADVSLIWKDAGTAFRVMASGGQVAYMEAIRDGSLAIEGDGQLAMTFIGTVKEMFRASRKK